MYCIDGNALEFYIMLFGSLNVKRPREYRRYCLQSQLDTIFAPLPKIRAANDSSIEISCSIQWF